MPWSAKRHLELLEERLDPSFYKEFSLSKFPDYQKQEVFPNQFFYFSVNSGGPLYLTELGKSLPVKKYGGYYLYIAQLPEKPKEISQFLESLFFNMYDPHIQRFIFCGQATFCSQLRTKTSRIFGEFKVRLTKEAEESKDQSIVKYSLRIIYKDKEKYIDFLQVMRLSESSLNLLKTDVLSNDLEGTTVAHFSGENEMSEALVYSLVLYKKFNDIFSGENAEIQKKIKIEIEFLKCLNSGTQQKIETIKTAIEFAILCKKTMLSASEGADLFRLPTVCVIGAFDTKGKDFEFLRQEILSRGLSPLMVNIGVGIYKPKEINFHIDCDVDEVLKVSNTKISIEQLLQKDRPDAISIIKNAVKDFIGNLYKQGFFDAIIGMGGTNGTALVTKAMRQRELPRSMPKICVTTHLSQQYTKTSGILLIPSIGDVGGINFLSREVYTKAVDCLYGLLRTYMKNKILREDAMLLSEDVSQSQGKKTKAIGMSMFGTSTPCVEACQKHFESQGYEVVNFHALDDGGKNMEHFVKTREIVALCDVTTTEIADNVGGGVFGVPNRLKVSGEVPIPHIIVPGCLDMINFIKYEEVKARFPKRTIKECNKEVTVMRTTVQENGAMGEFIAKRANAALKNGSSIAIVIPLQGLSKFDNPKDAKFQWYDPEANKMLFATLLAKVDKNIPILMANYHINDLRFAALVSKVTLALINNELNLKEFESKDVEVRYSGKEFSHTQIKTAGRWISKILASEAKFSSGGGEVSSEPELEREEERSAKRPRRNGFS